MGHESLPVSVVIPAFRRPEMVERAVRSVLAQESPPAEVIVVDDASGDGTGERAASLGARVVTHDSNRGRGAARNSGLGAASHDWVALLDCDDEWLPTHLETLWAARGDHLLVGSAGLVTDVAGYDGRVYGWTGRHPRLLKKPADVAIPENKLVSSAVMMRRASALELGGFRTDLERAEDLDLWVRMLGAGSGVAIPRITVLYHLHAGQISTNADLMRTAHSDVLRARLDGDRAARRRQEGAFAWDSARAALAGGAPNARTVLGLARGLASPSRAIGAAELLAGRFRGRRLGARHAPDGGPSTAIMPGVAVAPGLIAGAVDLRDRSLAGALGHLLRRPTRLALVRGRVSAVAVRALGVSPRTSPREDSPPS